jgi:hypothetical protein
MDKHEILEAQLRRFEATMESLIRDGSSIEERRTAWSAGCELLDQNAAEAQRDWLDGALFCLHSRIWNSRRSGAVARPQNHGHASEREPDAAFLQG